MRLFGRLRRASANNRSTSSVVAPASAKIGPAASAPSLGLAPDFSSWPIIFAIWAMAVRGIILGFSRIGRADYGTAQQSTAAGGGSAWLRSPTGLYNRHRSGAARIRKLAGRCCSNHVKKVTRGQQAHVCVLAADSAEVKKLRNRHRQRTESRRSEELS